MPTTLSPSYLIDTNILLRYVDSNHALYQSANHAIETLFEFGSKLYIAPQNCIEFWNVATRPAERNGFGMTPTNADALLNGIEQIFALLSDIPSVYPEWRQLVTTFGVSGVQVHDARLVAIMRVNQISHLLSFNTKDFIRYSAAGIIAVDPSQI